MRKVLHLFVISAFLTACGNESATSETAEASEPTAVGMERVLDGSSVEAFEADLAKIESEVSPKEYRALRAAIAHQMMYDVGAKRDKATLYQRLDGLTANQIVDRGG